MYVKSSLTYTKPKSKFYEDEIQTQEKWEVGMLATVKKNIWDLTRNVFDVADIKYADSAIMGDAHALQMAVMTSTSKEITRPSTLEETTDEVTGVKTLE